MQLQEIDVLIDNNGDVRIEVRGVKGPACRDITKDLEMALGGDITNREMTPEAGQRIEQNNPAQQWLGKC